MTICTPDAAICSALRPLGGPFGDGLRRSRRQESVGGLPCLAIGKTVCARFTTVARFAILTQTHNCLADGVHFTVPENVPESVTPVWVFVR